MSTRSRHDRRDAQPEHTIEHTIEHTLDVVCVCTHTLRTCPPVGSGKSRIRQYTPATVRTTTRSSSSSSSSTVVVVTETLKWVLNLHTALTQSDTCVCRLSTKEIRHVTPEVAC